MKTILRKQQKQQKSVWIFAIIIAFLGGCSQTEEKVSEETSVSSADAKAVEGTKDAEGSGEKPQDQTTAQEPPKEESVVEVMPATPKDVELKVEPILQKKEPEISAADTEKEPTKESPSAADSKPADAVKTEKPKSPDIKIPVSTGPEHFVITAGVKDSSHPLYGKGHKMGFLINNVQGKEIVIERGKSYRFDIATDPMHDVYISLKEVGWGSVPYSDGIEGMYTYNGTMTIKPDDKTPDLLFYSCRNHPYMGGKIHVVDPGQTVKIAKQTESKPATVQSKQEKEISQADANQKIMFANMLMTSKNTQSISKSNVSKAVDLYKKAEQALESAKTQLKAGDNANAYKNAERSIELLKQSTKLVPNESQLAHMKERNKELLASVSDFEASHKENFERISKKQGKDAAIDYDRKKVDQLKSEAATLATKGDFGKANENLEEAQHMITEAIHKMLNNQTIVYDLKFESPKEEYEYELKRYGSYEELIPIAIEQKQPAESAIKLMESFVEKGKSLRDRAVQKAKENDYPTAIAMMQDATVEIRRGLRMVGVMQ